MARKKDLKLVAAGPHAQGVVHPDVRIKKDQTGYLVISNDGETPLVVAIRYEGQEASQVRLKPGEAELVPDGDDPHYLIYEEI